MVANQRHSAIGSYIGKHQVVQALSLYLKIAGCNHQSIDCQRRRSGILISKAAA